MKIRKELYFGFSLMVAILLVTVILMPWGNMSNGHLGLLMLSLVVVAIMLGFPTAFTLMGMGVFFAWLAYHSGNPELAVRQTLDLMVQRAYAVMSNDGSKVLWASNWGQHVGQERPFLVQLDMPRNWHTAVRRAR